MHRSGLPHLAQAFIWVTICCVPLLASIVWPESARPDHEYGGDADCREFRNQRVAQRFFQDQAGPEVDDHRLDFDRDAVACERLPCPCNRPNGAGIGFTFAPRVAGRRTPIVLRFRAPRKSPTRSSLFYAADILGYPQRCRHDLAAYDERYRVRRGESVVFELHGVDLDRAGRVRRVPWCLGRHWGELYICTYEETATECLGSKVLAYFSFRVVRR